jgi:hypothetical protein
MIAAHDKDVLTSSRHHKVAVSRTCHKPAFASPERCDIFAIFNLIDCHLPTEGTS